MFAIRLKTTTLRPDLQITLRNNVDGWDHDLPGFYAGDEWRWELPEDDYPQGLVFKFMLERTYWMTGPNLVLQPVGGGETVFDAATVEFPAITEAIVENSHFQQRFFQPNLDEAHPYDVIVIGSGAGGGVVAEQLADLGADVLVLEAGSLLFTTHIANLPRQHMVGMFDKHVWGLFDEYRVLNYVKGANSKYDGGQAFNLGGRTVFWGGLIPRMTWWELDSWPQSIRWYLEDSGYQRAEDLIYWPLPPSVFQQNVKSALTTTLPDFVHYDAPVAVRQVNPASGTIAPGLFSTADLLTESRLTDDPAGNQKLTINLNHAVIQLEQAGNHITNVVCHDLLVNKQRRYTARYVVLAAGCVESAKLALLSGLADPHNLVGVGITDHPIAYTHFSIPPGSPFHTRDSSSKTLSRHHQASTAAHPYNMVLEIGADLNQGRYLDPDILARHRLLKGDATLCDVVFLFNAALVAQNHLDHAGPSFVKPVIHMQDSPAANAHWAEIDAVKNAVIARFDGEPIVGDNLNLKRAGLGGVAHEVGTLRLASGGPGVVDENLQWNGYDNLYVCDLSVFPASPAANPTLTLVALALRLADLVKSRL